MTPGQIEPNLVYIIHKLKIIFTFSNRIKKKKMTETVWLTKPKAGNTVWQFTEKIYQLLYIDLWVRKDLSFLRVTSEELIKAMDSFPQNDVEIHVCTTVFIVLRY